MNQFNPQTGRFKRYLNDPKNPQSLSSNSVVAVLVDHTNNVWAGTNGGGLNRFNQHLAQFTRFNHDSEQGSSLGNDRAIALLKIASTFCG